MAIDAGKKCGNCPTVAPVSGFSQEKAHETQAVVVEALVRREKQVARKWRHRRDDRILEDESAALGDLDPLVDVDTRILAANDVFGRREESPASQHDQRHRGQGAQARPGSAGRQSQPKPRPRRCHERNRQIRQNQFLEAVAIGCSQTEHGRRRDHDGDHDAPEEPFLGVEGSALAAIGNRQPEDDGARKPKDDEGVERSHAVVGDCAAGIGTSIRCCICGVCSI